MYCNTCRSIIPDGSDCCPVCGAQCRPSVAQNEVNAVPVNVIDYTTNGTPHYGAPQPPKKKKTGLVIGIAVAAVTAIIAIVFGCLYFTGTLDEWINPHPPAHECGGNGGETNEDDFDDDGNTVNNPVPSEIAKALEEEYLEDDGRIIDDLDVEYALTEGGATYYVISGRITDVTEGSDEDYVGGYIVAEVLEYNSEIKVGLCVSCTEDNTVKFNELIEEQRNPDEQDKEEIREMIEKFVDRCDGDD